MNNEIKDRAEKMIESSGVTPMNKKERIGRYPKTDVFEIIDSQQVPHEYMMSKKLIGYIATNFNGKISREAIAAFEKTFGPGCEVTGCNLSIEEHVVAVVLEINTTAENAEDAPGLLDFQNSCIPMMIEDGAVGFLFKRKQVKDSESS